ncbi:MAG: hypothetical protein KDG54_19165, partial [Geminicoccaceae bacterium]|nr:hypothetical protein [Geminicoccaceae bacterium]
PAGVGLVDMPSILPWMPWNVKEIIPFMNDRNNASWTRSGGKAGPLAGNTCMNDLPAGGLFP